MARTQYDDIQSDLLSLMRIQYCDEIPLPNTQSGQKFRGILQTASFLQSERDRLDLRVRTLESFIRKMGMSVPP